ncbi:hypothetical protein QZH36_18345 [Erwinia sp. BC051422]|uniref:phage baseplate protein n=1 Tax=Erwinia wuhanensis TaxID=3045167 RepID=UPI00264D867B|nr:hypothetical protein [Erwinia sp. BC051422]MDN8543367.1 hypothetical protein [Erwinia sp. BC051422]
MAKNDFKPFATGESANVLSQADYEALDATANGFQTGIARSEQLNKVWRQASTMSHVIGQFIADNSGEDVKDDGNTEEILGNFQKALQSKLIIEAIYPIGIVVWFAQNKNPNVIFPGTTWKYIGENKTIRLGSASGGDVMTTGGADQISLAIGNLPAHNHTYSASTSTFDYGTVGTSGVGDHGHSAWTDAQGNHQHGSGMRLPSNQDGLAFYGTWEAPGGSAAVSRGGSGAAIQAPTSANGQHSHNVGIGGSGAHSHSVGIGAHSHTLSGTTSNTGSGAAISIVNTFIKLMGWYRTA